ncbi:glutamate receptor ionotropic, delta-1-like isoform X2 [Petromyzon marinus]|uniref:Glutamate receptor n=1 Tax=Petromyzon marinus TaxID=7757 RepID=A0AAJ7WPI4_PETMA|nr:glutamate receptor ionotropic, delta-1-like isoform X2 [Petromyzon marinus]
MGVLGARFLLALGIVVSCYGSVAIGDSIIHIGAVFERTATKDAEVFGQAVSDINGNDEILQSEKIAYSVKYVDGNNPFQAVQEACELMAQGILALVSSTGCSQAGALRALTDSLHIPHLFVQRGAGGSPHSDCQRPRAGPGYTLVLRPPALATQVALRAVTEFHWQRFLVFYDSAYDLRGLQSFLDQATRQGLSVSLQRVDANVSSLLAGLFSSLPIEELNRFRDLLRRTVLLLSPRNAKVFIAEAIEANLAAMDSHWIFVNEEINDAEIQELASTAIGRLTVIRQSFPVARNASQRCIRNNHRISESLCGTGDAKSLEVSSRYVYDSVLLLANAFHRKLEDRKWHSMASLSCLRKSSKPWNGGRSMLDTIRKGRVSGLTGILDFGDDALNHNVQFEILGTSYSELFGRDVRRLAVWDPVRGLNGTLRDRRLENNMNGISLRVIAVLEEPFVMLAENVLGKPKKFQGFSVDVMDALSKSLGFSYEIFMPADLSYGLPQADGTWSGMIGELLNKRADVAISALTITPERESVVDFTKRYMDYSVGVAARRPADSAGLFALLSPLEPATWACLGLAVGLVGLLVYLLNRVTPRREPRHSPSLPASLWLVYGSFMQQGPELSSSSLSARLVMGVWWLFAFIVVSSYTASLTALLTINRMDPPIRSMQDLVRQSDLQYGTVLDSAVFEHIKMKGLNPLVQDGLFAEMWKVIGRNNGTENCVRDPWDGIRRVKAGSFAFLWDSAVLEYAALNDPECSIVTFPSTMYTKGYGMALQHGSPYRDVFSQRILELHETGELEAMRQRWWPRAGKCDPMGHTREPSGGPDGGHMSRALGLRSFAGVFCLLAMGLLLACLVAVLEIWWNRRKRHRGPNNQDDKEMDMQQFHRRLNSLSLDDEAAHKQIPSASGPAGDPQSHEMMGGGGGGGGPGGGRNIPSGSMRSAHVSMEQPGDYPHAHTHVHAHGHGHSHVHAHGHLSLPPPPPPSSTCGFLPDQAGMGPAVVAVAGSRPLPSKLSINLPLGGGCGVGMIGGGSIGGPGGNVGEHMSVGTFKHRAPNGGMFRQSPMKPATPVPFQSLSATIPEDPEETNHGTSI